MAGKIFINYRREDSTGTATRLHDRLAQEFGRENLFEDVVGVDLKARLNNQVAACQVFLTVIGPNWLDAKDEAGQRRLHHPDDFVAVEIAAALARNICIIPVLVDGARMPKAKRAAGLLEAARAPPSRRGAPNFILTRMSRRWSKEYARRSMLARLGSGRGEGRRWRAWR